jgi:hypothetical protein
MLKKKIPLPVPLHRWFNDIASIEELRTILSSEAFQTAAATLKDVAGPTNASLSTSEHNSLRLAWYAGYRDAFADLEKLTKIPAQNETTANTEWTHIVPKL